MTQKLPISVFIITKNEADRIGATINSVLSWVDEVIVVDSGSTDSTVEVAKECGADKVIFNEWNGYGAQKIFSEQLCKHDWILNLDADEEVSPFLREEIIATFANGTPQENHAYGLRCVLMFAHQSKPSRFAYVNAPIRLYNRKTAGFRNSTVHDSVIPNGSDIVTKTFKGDVYHRSFRSLEHMVTKLNNYSTMQAQELFAKGKNFPLIRALIEPYLMFFKFYILRKHFVYGFFGLAASRNYAYYRFLRIAKLRELWAKKDNEKHTGKFDNNAQSS